MNYLRLDCHECSATYAFLNKVVHQVVSEDFYSFPKKQHHMHTDQKTKRITRVNNQYITFKHRKEFYNTHLAIQIFNSMSRN